MAPGRGSCPGHPLQSAERGNGVSCVMERSVRDGCASRGQRGRRSAGLRGRRGWAQLLPAPRRSCVVPGQRSPRGGYEKVTIKTTAAWTLSLSHPEIRLCQLIMWEMGSETFTSKTLDSLED